MYIYIDQQINSIEYSHERQRVELLFLKQDFQNRRFCFSQFIWLYLYYGTDTGKADMMKKQFNCFFHLKA